MGTNFGHNLIPFPGWQGLGFALGEHLREMGVHPGEFSFDNFNATDNLMDVLTEGAKQYGYEVRCSQILEQFVEKSRFKEAG